MRAENLGFLKAAEESALNSLFLSSYIPQQQKWITGLLPDISSQFHTNEQYIKNGEVKTKQPSLT